MADFLLELRSEEIPARMAARGAQALADGFAAACAARGLPVERLEAHHTPRRLALLAWDLPDATAATREERRGPRADAPEAAIAGFCKSAGVARDALEARNDPKGRFLYAIIDTPGRPAADVLAEACAEAVGGLTWPKSMRWGAASAAMDSPRWVRPLEAVLALIDEQVIPVTLLGIAAGRTTRGHRVMGARNPIVIERPATYAAQLREAFVMLNAAERASVIKAGARAQAAGAGLVLVEDAALVAENAALTEWPVPLLGRFDPVFLHVPREIIQLTMKVNQKYFACTAPDGTLAPAFICIANLDAPDGGAAIVEGNRRVLAARLADARFFWEQDLAAWQAAAAAGPDGLWDALRPRLERLALHERLGSMARKAQRIGRLARWLAGSGAVPGADPDLAGRAGRLAKADLVSATVGEFPELQGIIGGHLARAVGEPEAVADAIADHYRPAGPADAVPTAPVSVAVALADKLDTLVGFFAIGEAPTGSRDPFALRRAGLGIIAIMRAAGLRLRARLMLEAALEEAGEALGPRPAGLVDAVSSFLEERLVVQLREAGISADVTMAARSARDEGGQLWLIEANARALQAFLATDDGANLLAAFRRAANILADEETRDGVEYRLDAALPLSRYVGEAEQDLARLFHPSPGDDSVLLFDEVDSLLAQEEFAGAMTALARLRAPVDRFFAELMVNDPNPATRQRRLELLAGVRAAMRRVADFSKIEG